MGYSSVQLREKHLQQWISEQYIALDSDTLYFSSCVGIFKSDSETTVTALPSEAEEAVLGKQNSFIMHLCAMLSPSVSAAHRTACSFFCTLLFSTEVLIPRCLTAHTFAVTCSTKEGVSDIHSLWGRELRYQKALKRHVFVPMLWFPTELQLHHVKLCWPCK